VRFSKNLQIHCQWQRKSRFGDSEIDKKISLDGMLAPNSVLSWLVNTLLSVNMATWESQRPHLGGTGVINAPTAWRAKRLGTLLGGSLGVFWGHLGALLDLQRGLKSNLEAIF